MKRPFRWGLWLALAGQMIGPVIAEFMVLSGPEYTYGPWYQNTYRQAKHAFCITDDMNSALVWNTYFEWGSKSMEVVNDSEKKSEVISSESYVYSNDDLTCQMSQYSSCSNSWIYESNWRHISNLEKPMSPIFDNRWEDFVEESISEEFRHIMRLQDSGVFSVSIRASTDAHFAICDQYSIQSFCFFIILGGWGNTLSVLRKCEKGIPDPITKWPTGDCRTVIASHNASVLSPSEWKTFTIKWNFQEKIMLSVYNTHENILYYEMPKEKNYFTGKSEYSNGAPITSYYYLYARGRDKMKMKFHKYSYSLTTTTQSKLLSPKFMATPPGKTVCVEMSISLCRTCTMTVDFLDQYGNRRPGKIVRYAVKNNLYDLPTWQNVKINKTLTKLQEPVMLEINTLNNDSTTRNSSYWAISNVRRCFDGTIKVVPFTDYQDYSDHYFWPNNITCQKISADGTSEVIHLNDLKKSTIEPEKRQSCPEGKIGSSCSVSCSKLFQSSGDCRRLLACDVYGCSCGQGFIQDMPKCDSYCPLTTYGYNCKQKCGNCAYNSCHFATGHCSRGCNNTVNNYYLPPNCKEGIGSPPIPSVEHINSTLIRLFLDMKNEYKNIPTIIHFEVWENSTAIFISKNITINGNTVIEAFAERLRPGTHYKVAGFVHAVNRTFRSEWGTFITSCTESVDFNFVTTPEENSITVNNSIHDLFKDPCPYTWYRVQLYNGSQLLFNESTRFPKTFTNLSPDTRFRVVIMSEKSTIVDRIVRTLEGVPTEVTNLVDSRFSDIIICTWEPPLIPNGIIVNYTVQIEPIKSLGCNDFNKLSYRSAPDYNASEFKKKSVITNTSQTSYRWLFSGLKPYTEYLITLYACTSRHCGIKTERTLQTLSHVNPTEVFTNLRLTNETSATIAAKLRWDPPSDCSSITGTIQAAKLYIKKLGGSFKTMETNTYYYDLEKSLFEGTEYYEVRLHTLRYSGSAENKTAYISLKFRMPDREPPPVQDFDVVEVDVQDQVTMLRWKVPSLPHHGNLDYYSISLCGKYSRVCNENHRITVNNNEYCTLWNFKDRLCKSISLPNTTYYNYKITAHNKGVTEPSEPVFIPIQRLGFEPSAPTDLLLDISNKEKASVIVVWNHPLKTGGRLSKFEIQAYLINSSLKFTPWEYKDYIINDTYYSQYVKMVDLLPSSSFTITVRAVTRGGIAGSTIEKRISLPNAVNFNSTNLTPKSNDDQMISITIPAVMNDIKGSAMVILVKGLKYCDDEESHSKDNVFINSQESPNFNLTWKAAILTDPDKYANNEFKIGDGKVYSGVKNYRLCSKEKYVVRIVLVDKYKNLKNKFFKSSDPSILAEIESNAIYIGESSKNYAMWMTPLFLIIVITILSIFMYYRKLCCLITRPPKALTSLQENMPLSNDFSTCKSNNILSEVEADTKNNDVKEVHQNNVFIVEKKAEYVMPIKVQDFGNYFEYAFKSGALNNEYKTIKSGLTRPCTYGSQAETKPKNRYANLFPYDDTRVVLEKLPDDPFSDYINANFITGYGEIPKAYIATQGPKPNSVIDFWRMVWQEKVKIICMMANLIENGKTKCEQYWPSAVSKKVLYGTISVKFASEEVHSDYTYRTFQISCNNQEIRTIEHLHFTAWPDHGVPSNPRSIVAFLQEIQRHAPAPRKTDDPPIIVHCSAGVGRTGTLIVLDMAVCRIFSEQVIDVYANVLSVRKERLNMVDNTEQYLLVHLVLVEFLNSKDTCFTCDNTLPEKVKEAKKYSTDHYQRILDTSWWNEVLGSPPLPEKSVSNRNRAKHRFPESAGGLNRIYLKRSNRTDEDSDYIAATCVKGIFNNCQYITTQLPMPSTAADFWRMLTELNVELVLVLQLPNLQDPSYCELIPESQSYGSTKYLKIIREENSTVDSQFYQKEEVLIIDSSEQPSKEQTIKIISYKNWPESSLPPPNELVSLWKVFGKFPNKDNCPVVIVCRDGITASGLWLTLSILLKRMAIDKECDVLQAVRSIKRCRKDFFNRIEHLDYLYEVALEWFIQTER